MKIYYFYQNKRIFMNKHLKALFWQLAVDSMVKIHDDWSIEVSHDQFNYYIVIGIYIVIFTLKKNYFTHIKHTRLFLITYIKILYIYSSNLILQRSQNSFLRS